MRAKDVALFYFGIASYPAGRCMINVMQGEIAGKMKISIQLLGLIAVMLAINACGPQDGGVVASGEVDHDLYFVRGYRSDSDPCKLTGETGFTNQFLDDAADLVSCPTGYEGGKELVRTKHATVVAQKNGYTLYTVPRR